MSQIIYHFTIFICFITSLFVYKYSQSFKVFPWLMGATVVVEWIAYVLANIYVINPFWLYHFFLPVEGILMTYFFYYSVEEGMIKKVILFSAVLFVGGSLLLTFFYYRLTDFPGLQANMSGFLLIALSLYALLTLEPIYNVPLYKHPLAWVCIGIIVFYTGTFFLNGVHNYLIETKNPKRGLIHSLINNGLNCIMYSCFTVGLICSHKLKKYVLPAVKSHS